MSLNKLSRRSEFASHRHRSSVGKLQLSPNIIGVVALLLVPFIHFGASEYLSFAFLFFVFALTVLIFSRVSVLASVGLTLGAPLLLAALLLQLLNADGQRFLVNLREIAVLVVFLSLARVAGEARLMLWRMLVGATMFVFVWAALQFLAGIGGLSWGRPSASVYSLDYGTLASAMYERFGIISRPSAGFSEPSTLGAFGVLVVAIGANADRRILVILGAGIVALSQSLSAYAGLFMVLIVSVKAFRRQALPILLTMMLGLLMLAARIDDVLSLNDESLLYRIQLPLRVIAESWSVLGLGRVELDAMTSRVGGQGNVLDVYYLGKLLTDGFYLLLLLPILWLNFSASLFLVLAIMMFVNGSPFYYDRLVMYSVAATFLSGVSKVRR